MGEKTCNVPECEKPVSARGLCGQHWHRAFRGKDGPAKDEAVKYMNPLIRKAPAKAAPPPVVSDAADLKRERGQAGRIDQAQARKSKEADERVAAITEFATAIGVEHIDYNGGRLYPCPKTGGFVFLTEGGNLQNAILSLGTAQ